MSDKAGHPSTTPLISPTPPFSCSQGSLMSDTHVGLAENDWVVIGNTACLYGVFGVIMLIVFEVFRGNKSVFLRRASKLKNRTPKIPGRDLFQWIPPIFSVSNEEMRRMVGLDGYVCIRYIMWCLKVCTFCSFWGLLVLLPLYHSGDYLTHDPWGVFTMDNIRDGIGWGEGDKTRGSKLWVSCVFNAIFTVYALYTMNLEWIHFVKHRTEFLARGDPDAEGGAQVAYSVRVEYLPRELRSDLALYAYFDNMFPGEVHSAVVHIEADHLLDLIEKRQVACEKLELALAKKVEKKEKIMRERGSHYSYLPTFKDEARGVVDQSHDDTSTEALLSTTNDWTIVGGHEVSSDEHKILPKSLQNSPVAQSIVEDKQVENPTEWLWECCDGEGVHGGQSRCCGLARKVDSIYYHAIKLDELNELVKQEQETVISTGNKVEKSIKSKLRDQVRALLRGDQLITNLMGGSNHNQPSTASNEGERHGITGALITGEKAVAGALKTGLKTGVEVITDDFGVLADTTILGIATVTRGLKILTVGESKSSSAYVTFKTKQAAADAVQVLLDKDALKMEVLQAPDPRDLIWANATVGARETSVRSGISTLALVIFALTGFIPLLIAINGSGKFFVKIERNKPVSDWFHDDDDAENTSSNLEFLLVTQLPVILQYSLNALLPVLFTFLSQNYEQAKSQSEVQQSVLSRYYGFTFVNILSTFGVRNLLDVLKVIVQQPSCLVQLLGASIPGNASYFVQYILLKILLELPMELCRILPLMRMLWFQKFQRSGASRRSIAQVQDETSEFSSGSIYPDFLLAIVVCFSYAVIAPFLMVFGVIYFSFALIVFKHQLLYVYIPKYESGGSLFETLYSHTLTGLNFANVTMFGYVALKQGYMQVATLVLPLIFLVEYFRYYTKIAYLRQTTVVSKEVAVDIDRKYHPRTVASMKPPFSPTTTDSAPFFSDMSATADSSTSSLLSSDNQLSSLSSVGNDGSVEGGGVSKESFIAMKLASSLSMREKSFHENSSTETMDITPPYLSFDKNLYRQPALDTAALKPLPPKQFTSSKFFNNSSKKNQEEGRLKSWSHILDDESDFECDTEEEGSMVHQAVGVGVQADIDNETLRLRRTISQSQI